MINRSILTIDGRLEHHVRFPWRGRDVYEQRCASLQRAVVDDTRVGAHRHMWWILVAIWMIATAIVSFVAFYFSRESKDMDIGAER